MHGRVRTRRYHFELADVSADDQSLKLVVWAVSAERCEARSVGPALVDVDPCWVERVSGHHEVVVAGSAARELDGRPGAGQERVTVAGRYAKVAGDDDHVVLGS